MNAHFALLARAREALKDFQHRFVFVGGATVSLHLDDPASEPARATKDVDLVVEAAGYVDFAALEEDLRKLGFFQDPGGESSPICRWEKDGLLLDVVPTEPEILGFGASRWFREGFDNAREFELPGGTVIQAFAPLYLMAAKIEAFEDRGDGDWLLSQDIEDLITILDGRKTVFAELSAETEVAVFVRGWLHNQGDDFLDAIAAHVGTYARARYLFEKVRDLDR